MNPILRYLTFSALTFTTLHALGQSSDLDILDNTNVVLTPTRLRQPISEVPGSVTVITADMLATYGITTVPEALRLVPGMAVTQLTGGEYTVNYHGNNASAPRRMNVLIDGMSVYRSAFAQVDWTMLPVAIDDVERIEVTRGPNSASYGPNSMVAIINIITKHPNESAGTSLRLSAGSRQTRTATARHGGKLGQSTTYWLTLDRQQTAGLELLEGTGVTSAATDPHHDKSDRTLVNFRSSTEIGKNENIELRFSALNGGQERAVIDQYQQSYPDIGLQERDIGFTWRKSLTPAHDIEVSGYVSRHSNDQNWVTCLPALAYLPEMGALYRANAEYAVTILNGRIPSGGSTADNILAAAALRAVQTLGGRATVPACGTANQNYVENRADIEVQSTSVISDALRFVAGFGGRHDIAESETYLGGKVSNNTMRAFLNAEYRPAAATVINAGGYYERDNLTGSSFSPRLALNQHLDANNTVRMVVSRANRMPDIIEQRANWSYRTTGLNPALLGVTEAYFAQSARANGTLDAEKNTSREIGYTGNFPRYGLMIDAKLFDDRLTNLISERVALVEFNPTNGNALRLRGAELQVDYAPTPSWAVHAGYSRVNARATTPLELTQHSRNSGMFAASHLFPGEIRLSLAAHKSQGTPAGQTGFAKQDLTVSKRYQVRGAVLTPTLTVTHLNRTEMRYFYDSDESTTHGYGNQMQYRFIVKADF